MPFCVSVFLTLIGLNLFCKVHSDDKSALQLSERPFVAPKVSSGFAGNNSCYGKSQSDLQEIIRGTESVKQICEKQFVLRKVP